MYKQMWKLRKYVYMIYKFRLKNMKVDYNSKTCRHEGSRRESEPVEVQYVAVNLRGGWCVSIAGVSV